MDSSRRKYAFEVIGLIAIVLSLGVVAFEVRQNTAAVRSSVIQSVSDQSIEAISLMVENSDLRDGIDAAIKGVADEKQQRQVYAYYALLLRIQINRFLQVEVGAIDKRVILKMGAKAAVYDTPAFRNYWDDVKAGQSDEFRAYMESDVFSAKIVGTGFIAN